MTGLWQNLVEAYYNIDPRTKDFSLVENPYPLMAILAGYLLFCCKLGPWLMEQRRPYELKNTILVYNLVQILLSCYLAYQGTAVWLRFNFTCQPIDYSQTPYTAQAISVGWWYMFAKVTELLDTVFFVLRKKYNQVSFLHLFHHTLMPASTWVGLRYFAGGHGSIFVPINSAVHIVMYTYYLLAGLGPHYQKYLWWKKYVTIMQLVQFVIVFVHNFFPLFTSCPYPKGLNVLLLFFSSFFIYMFGNFYIQNFYVKRRDDATVCNGKKIN